MNSEHAVEQVPLAEIREGDTIQDPQSGQWITVTRTAEGTTSVIHKYSDGERTATQEDRVYYGDEGEIADSRFVKGTYLGATNRLKGDNFSRCRAGSAPRGLPQGYSLVKTSQ